MRLGKKSSIKDISTNKNTLIKCDMKKCFDNENGICVLSEIKINYDGMCTEYSEQDNDLVVDIKGGNNSKEPFKPVKFTIQASKDRDLILEVIKETK